MLENLFESRNKTVTSLIKLGACLGRSLRENLSLFAIDGENSLVSYLTEGDQVITGEYSVEEDITLNNLEVMSSKEFQSAERFDSFVKDKISNFTRGIQENSYKDADVSFTDVLTLWENRLKLSQVRDRLQEKTLRFDESLQILDTEEFNKFKEIAPQVVDFLKEKKESIIKIPEILNAFKLSNTVAAAFNFPKLSYTDLQEAKTYTLKEGKYDSIYEMICRQELVKQELLEAKKNFSTIWASNDKIRTLAGMIYEESDKVEEIFAECISEIPYLALISKKNLYDTVANSLSISEGSDIPEEDIKKYIGSLFEMKKPVKQEFLGFLNEKYGINVQNLKEPPTFKSLINTQVVIFEALSRISPKSSVQRQVLSEVASMLKQKSGVEGIDINECLYTLFTEAGYDSLITERVQLNAGSYKEIAQDFRSITDILDLIRNHAEMIAGEEQYESDETLEPEEGEEEGMEGEEEMVPPEEGMEDLPPEEQDDEMGTPAMDPDEVGIPPEEGEMEGEEEFAPEEEGMEGEEEDIPEDEAKEELLGNLKELEDLIADLQQDLGLEVEGEEEEEFEEEEEEEEMEDEEERDFRR